MTERIKDYLVNKCFYVIEEYKEDNIERTNLIYISMY